MPQKKCITIVFLLAFTSSNAQDTIKYDKAVFKIAPLNFIDATSFQTTQVGFEFLLVPKYSIDFSYGQVFGREFINHSKGKGFKAKTELRRYVNCKPLNEFYTYFALEGFYNKVDYPSSDEFENRADSTIYGEDYFIKKSVWGINIKYGVQINHFKRFVFDAFAGIGFRVKNVQHLDRTSPEDEFYSVDLLAIHVRDEQGIYTTPNLALGLKIGYAIK